MTMPVNVTKRLRPDIWFDRHRYRWRELRLLVFVALFLLLGFFQLQVAAAVQTGKALPTNSLPPLDAFIPAFGLIAALMVAHIALNILAPDTDQTLLPIAGALSSVGVVMATRLGPDLGRDDLGARQLVFVIVGLGACILTVWATRDLRWLRNYKYTWLAVGLVLVGVTLLKPSNFNTDSPSRDVLSIGSGGLAFQPSELLKICLVVFFAGYLSENREMLAQAFYRLGPLKLPPLKHLGPLIVMLGVALVLVVRLRELGLALLIFGLFLSMLYVASNRPLYVVGSLAAFAASAFLALRIFSYARTRLDIVSSAFNPGISNDAGFQLVQGLIAFASGGIFGSGLGLGKPWIVPESATDFIASSIGEEFGFMGVLALIGLFMLLVYRGLHVAVSARDSFNQLLAVGLTAVFALQTMVILAGNLKVLPLTGVPLPFVAYGGSSLIANFVIIGLLLRLSQRNA